LNQKLSGKPGAVHHDAGRGDRAAGPQLPQALKWQVARADEDYDAALVEARGITVDTTRIASESFPMAVPPEEAERRCHRTLMEAWVGRETAAFRLPPSRLALDPADAIRLAHDGRLVDLRLVSIAEADLGIPWNWRIGPASRPVSDETYVAQTFTPLGVGLRPYSVAHVAQPWRTPRTAGDLTIRWKRRSRALAADSWGGLEVPLAEELEAYEVEILDGAAVKRILSTATTSVAYTAAQQTDDWGGPLGPGDTVNICISQLFALIGRGAPKTVTLTF
jgi:hypothetical protein